jgi:hypothetical protein
VRREMAGSSLHASAGPPVALFLHANRCSWWMPTRAVMVELEAGGGGGWRRGRKELEHGDSACTRSWPPAARGASWPVVSFLVGGEC